MKVKSIEIDNIIKKLIKIKVLKQEGEKEMKLHEDFIKSIGNNIETICNMKSNKKEKDLDTIIYQMYIKSLADFGFFNVAMTEKEIKIAIDIIEIYRSKKSINKQKCLQKVINNE
jgi:hypothetical protein